jgi:hypothetical protein
MIRYEVEITGHQPPFKWQLKRTTNGTTNNLGDAGEAQTREEALWDAQDAAMNREYTRKHQTTKRTEVLFEVDEDALPDPPDSAEAEAWQDFQGA